MAAGVTILLFVVAAGLTRNTLAFPEVIKIVGLFTPAEQLLETTLKYAVDHVNTDVALLPNSRLSVQTEMLRQDNALDTYNKVCSRIEEGAVIVFGPSTTAENSLVSSICAAMHVPHLQTTWHQDLDVRPFSLGLVPGPELLGKAFREFVDRMGWLFFAYVYEGDQALVRLQEMERHEDIMGRKVLAFDLGAVGQPADRRRRRQTDAGEDDAIQEPKTVWDEIKESGYRNFIIDLPQDRIAGVLQEAKDAGLMTELHNFLITTLDFHVVNTKDLRNEDARIYSFRLLHLEDDDFALMSRRLVKYHPDLTTKSEEKETEVGLIYDAIHVLAEVLHNASKDGADFKFNAVECDNGTFLEDGQKLLDTFKGTTYDGFTGEIQFDEDGMREVDSLTLWQLHKGRSEHVATWSPEKGLDFVHDPHDDDGVPGSEDVDDTIDENSLENRTIIVTTVVSPPFVMLKDGSEQYEGNQRFEGFCVSLLDKLAEVLHFDYKLQLVKPEKFGYEVSPGRWTGLIGELVEGKVDMAAAPLTMTSKRSTVVEFTVPFMTLGIGLMASRQDETLVHSFLSPFSAATWCYLVLSLLAAMALLTLIGRLSPFEWDQVSETRVDSEYTLGNAFWFLFSGFTFQRVTITPRAPSTVVAFISWWIFSLIVMVAYASVLGEFIIRYRDRPTLNSVDDLLKQKDIKYGTYRRGSTQSFFQKSTFPKYMELWQGMQSQGDEAFVDNYYEGIERVIGGNYAMFLESPVLEYLENRYCEIEQVGDIMGSGGYALALPKGSPYQSELSAAITRLKFDGTLQLLRQYWWEDHNVANCPPEEHVYRPTPFTVRFGRLSLVFIFLLLGLLITMVIMLVIFVRGHSKRDVTAESMSTIWNTLLEELRSAMMCRKERKPQEATKDGEITPTSPPPVTVSPA
ncbi:glutamate receptor ionotropic, kainate 2 [Ixodes scapularis]|uniref:glutamate receptor ionotropic, kainate 2 n=1 Tax=Ixodes scapularis TaxID=6945 RepID=UPI001A9FD992|nr:glutamate receptor ionotropic, kainate 2 [Ixodes scapularis]